MALSEKMHKALNGQIAKEFQAHFLYRAISMDLYHKGFEGIAAWMDHHATEEYGHAEKIIGFLRENDAKVTLPAVPELKNEWGSVQEAIEDALGHERKLTGDIHQLHKMADEEGDLGTVSMLDWFVEEQVEEEHVVTRLLKRIKLAGNSDIGLFVIDAELRGSPVEGSAEAT
jgi:ferritin